MPTRPPPRLGPRRRAGSQYTSIRLTEHLALEEIRPSIGSVGDYDNAMAEAFNSLFKAECIRNPVMRPKGGWKSCLELGWRDQADLAMEPSVVEPVDVFGDGDLDVTTKPGAIQ